jgi:lysozyme family protein
MSDFNVAVNLVLAHEGGYVNNPDDPGGETNFGISKRAYPTVDIKNLTREEAIAIYKRDYWKSWMEAQTDQHLANCLLDSAVNQGVAAAAAMEYHSKNLKEFQLARLLRYTLSPKAQFYRSWFSRVLDC